MAGRRPRFVQSSVVSRRERGWRSGYRCAVDWREDVWSRFKMDVPGYVLIWIAITAIAVVLQRLDGRGSGNPMAVVLATAVLGVALAPLLWMRTERPVYTGRYGPRRTFALIGVGCLWAAVALVGGLFVLALLGIE